MSQESPALPTKRIFLLSQDLWWSSVERVLMLMRTGQKLDFWFRVLRLYISMHCSRSSQAIKHNTVHGIVVVRTAPGI